MPTPSKETPVKGRLCTLVLLVAAAGCGSDSTAPKTDVTGTWSYSASNLTVSGVTCTISSVSMTFAQTGTTFTGTVASGGLLSCTGPAGSDNEVLGSDVIANGVVNGNAVQFDIGTSDFHNTGTLSGNTISGTAAVNVTVNGVVAVLTGNFSATKH
jgi:hypothetical protein